MLINSVLISDLSCYSHGVSAIRLIPEVDPFTEWHFRIYLFGRLAILFLENFKFFGTLGLGFRCNVLGYR